MKNQPKLARAPRVIEGSFYEINGQTMWASSHTVKMIPDCYREEAVSKHKDEQFSLKNRNLRQ